MNMTQDQWRMLAASYLRALLGSVMTAIWTVGGATHRTPFEFDGGDWALVLNAVWISIVPPLIRWLNKNDGAFGKVEAAQ